MGSALTKGTSDPKIMEAVACRERLALASDLMCNKKSGWLVIISQLLEISEAHALSLIAMLFKRSRHEKKVSLQLSLSMQVGCLMEMLIG